jgi:hypothetical protein
MKRQELLSLRGEMWTLVRELEHVGDFDAHASSIRALANASLAILDHLASLQPDNSKP